MALGNIRARACYEISVARYRQNFAHPLGARPTVCSTRTVNLADKRPRQVAILTRDNSQLGLTSVDLKASSTGLPIQQLGVFSPKMWAIVAAVSYVFM